MISRANSLHLRSVPSLGFISGIALSVLGIGLYYYRGK